jgi:hypothetical protein
MRFAVSSLEITVACSAQLVNHQRIDQLAEMASPAYHKKSVQVDFLHGSAG